MHNRGSRAPILLFTDESIINSCAVGPNMLEESTGNSKGPTLEDRLQMLQGMEHKGHVKSLNPRQKVSDEELIAIFKEIKGRWFYVEDLKEALEGLIPVNTKNQKRTPINSSYLRRLRGLTGKKWRQKRATDDGGRILVKVYVRRG